MQTSHDHTRLSTYQATAHRLSVSVRTVQRLAKEGALEVVYVRGAPRITERSINRLTGG